MCGINAVGAQGSGCMFTLCHAPLKMAVLLHKTEKVWDSFSETVCSKWDRMVYNTGLTAEKRGPQILGAQIVGVYCILKCNGLPYRRHLNPGVLFFKTGFCPQIVT